MANEIQYSFTLQFSKGGAADSKTASANVTVTGNDYVRGTQVVGTTDETISLGDIGTPGWCFLHNLDGTNYVEAGPDGTNYFVKCKAGEYAMFRVGSAAVHVKANTASCSVEYMIIED